MALRFVFQKPVALVCSLSHFPLSLMQLYSHSLQWLKLKIKSYATNFGPLGHPKATAFYLKLPYSFSWLKTYRWSLSCPSLIEPILLETYPLCYAFSVAFVLFLCVALCLSMWCYSHCYDVFHWCTFPCSCGWINVTCYENDNETDIRCKYSPNNRQHL
jgi:hypothetical protein